MADKPTPQATPATQQADRYDEASHVLPKWVNFIIENWLLTFLLLAEAYLLGTLMTLGWVKDIEAPAQWGWYHTIGVVLFFATGATAAGWCLQAPGMGVRLLQLPGLSGLLKRRDLGVALRAFVELAAHSSG
jgi:hypothetical protein